MNFINSFVVFMGFLFAVEGLLMKTNHDLFFGSTLIIFGALLHIADTISKTTTKQKETTNEN